jgi:heterodisulfide reductase subunit C
MAYGPRKIMHMVHLGMADRLLRSQDIWYCVSCFSCAARCPQGIEIADVMSALRNMAVAGGLAEDKEAIFSRIFLKVLQEHGRMYEPEVLLRYYASVRDVDAMVKIAPLGLRMFIKSKIGLLPQRIENAGELGDIAAQINRRQGT